MPIQCSVGFVLIISIFKGYSFFELKDHQFPENLLFGVATSAYQIEGAWNVHGKGESIWDHLTHSYPHLIIDGSNGDVACDSYNKVEEDVALLKQLGVDVYHFSLSWTRILPNGFATEINKDAINYYNHLITSLLNNGIEPVVTLYHWDLPQVLQKLGGWANVIMADYFLDYAQVAFDNFGDNVKYWISFSQPEVFCAAYGASKHAPVNVNADGFGDYLCGHTVLLAHAAAYRLYNESYRFSQDGSFGIALSGKWFEPNSTSSEDVLAAYRMLQFTTGWFANPLFKGDYPAIMKEAVAQKSQEQGFPYSRLPEFTEEEIKKIRGTVDFLAFNYYTTEMVANRYEDGRNSDPSCELDCHVNKWVDKTWKRTTTTWLKAVSWGFRNVLLWLKDEYNNPPIYVTENGFADLGSRHDVNRVNFLKYQLSALLEAIERGVNIKSYSVWSLMDNFEWTKGYTVKYGLYYVDMSDANRRRTPKSSAHFYKDVISNRKVVHEVPKQMSDASKTSKNIFFTIMVILVVLILS